jgi:hypothetical protein
MVKRLKEGKEGRRNVGSVDGHLDGIEKERD